MRLERFGLVGAITLAWLAGGCSGGSGIPVITTGAEYGRYLKKVQDLSLPIFVKADSGLVLNEQDRKDLRESIKLFDGLSAFNPQAPTLYFGIGKCQMLLGEYKLSLGSFQAAANLLKSSQRSEHVDTLAETQYLSSISFERIGSYHEAKLVAESAARLRPQSANYWAALASAEIQLKELENAKKHLDNALKIDPANKRARYLLRMIEISQES